MSAWAHHEWAWSELQSVRARLANLHRMQSRIGADIAGLELQERGLSALVEQAGTIPPHISVRVYLHHDPAGWTRIEAHPVREEEP